MLINYILDIPYNITHGRKYTANPILAQNYGQPRRDAAWDQAVGVGNRQSTYPSRGAKHYLINNILLRMVDSIMRIRPKKIGGCDGKYSESSGSDKTGYDLVQRQNIHQSQRPTTLPTPGPNMSP